MRFTELLTTMYQSMVESLVNSVPKILTGVVLVIVALCIAKSIEWVLRVVFSRVGLDALVERVGIDKTLERIGLSQPLSRLLPRLAFFLLLFLFAQTAAEAMKLEPVSSAIGGFLGYLPNLVSAFLLVVLGSVAGQFAGRAVSRSARESGIDYSSALGNAVSMLILFIAGIMAIGQLKTDDEIIRIVTFCVLAGVALAFGLSFGLGTRDITRNIVAGFYARKILEPGSEIEIRGTRGILRAITPVQTIVEVEDERITVANSAFLDEVITTVPEE
jgi:hypothetical protein